MVGIEWGRVQYNTCHVTYRRTAYIARLKEISHAYLSTYI